MTLKELQARREKLAAEIRTFADEAEKRTKESKPAFDEEQRKNYDKLNDDYDAVLAQINRANETKELEDRRRQLDDDEKRSSNRGGFDPRDQRSREDEESRPTEAEDRSLIFQAWMRTAAEMPLTDEHRAACKRMKFNPRSKEYNFRLNDGELANERQREFRGVHPSQAQKRAMSVGVAAKGGTTVPQGFLNSLEVAMLAFNGVEPYATLVLTDSGNPLPMPTANDTNNEGAIVGENALSADLDAATGVRNMGAYKFSSLFIKISSELLEDSAFNFAQIAGAMAGERIGRHAEKKFTIGTGTNEPGGIVTRATVGRTAASATLIAADELIDLQHSVDPAYRSGPGVAFMMHDSIIRTIRKLKHTDGTYIWNTGLAAGVPDSLLGSPVATNQNMAAASVAGARTVLYGDISKYFIRRVRTVRLLRLEERFADLDQIGFIMFVRQDGDLLDAGTNPVKVLIQA